MKQAMMDVSSSKKMTIVKKGVTFDIDPKTERDGRNWVKATMPDAVYIGSIPGNKNRVYPRMNFYGLEKQGLYQLADDRGWDEDETSDAPFSWGSFRLTDDEALAISEWRDPVPPLLTGDRVEIFELGNTWGCGWRNEGSDDDEAYFGFDEFPSSARLWLEEASGDAVEQVIDAGIGTIVDTKPGAYGGVKRTVSVSVDELEKVCRRYWDRLNARYEQHEKQNHDSCHYCGAPAVAVGFFGEPVCRQCGG